MISRLELKHFKCFEAINLPLKSLSLLTGENSSGKSSIMQAFALLHQTVPTDEWSSNLILNGSSVDLGSAAEVVDQLNGQRSCTIALHDANDDWFAWEFGVSEDEDSDELKTEKTMGEAHGIWKWEQSDCDALRFLLPPRDAIHAMTRRLKRLL